MEDQHKNNKLPQKVGKYTLEKELGSGTYGYVGLYYSGEQKVAIKFSSPIDNSVQEKVNLINIDSAFKSSSLKEERRFPMFINNIQATLPNGQSVSSIIMEYFEYPIQAFYEKNKSIQQLIFIAREIILALKQIHFLGFIHRDVKLDNICVQSQIVKFIDFGTACSYFEKEKIIHIKDKSNRQMRGTPYSSSIFSHNNKEVSRRDDLISAIYCIMYLNKKESLPWIHLCEQTEKEDKDVILQQIYNIKCKLSPKKLLYKDDQISQNLVCLVLYLEEIAFDETPDYNFLLEAISNLENQGEFLKILSNQMAKIVKRFKLNSLDYNQIASISIYQPKPLLQYEQIQYNQQIVISANDYKHDQRCSECLIIILQQHGDRQKHRPSIRDTNGDGYCCYIF